MAGDEGGRLDRELIELLNELRVAMPGVQVLFAFLLIVPFSARWDRVSSLQRNVFFVDFMLTAAASVLLIAPSIHHRVLWRQRDKERLLRTSNQLAIAGTVALALAMAATTFLVADVVFSETAAGVAAGALCGAFAWLWYGVPLARRARR